MSMVLFPGVAVLAAAVLTGAILALLLLRRFRARRPARREPEQGEAINQAIIDYFRKTGVQVAVETSRARDGKGYIALVESEPMKRFRLSHIIENTLRDHVGRACGLALEKIYWRFPIRQANADAADPADMDVADGDDYINEGLEHYRHIPRPEVTELDWEHFQRAATGDGRDSPPSGPDK